MLARGHIEKLWSHHSILAEQHWQHQDIRCDYNHDSTSFGACVVQPEVSDRQYLMASKHITGSNSIMAGRDCWPCVLIGAHLARASVKQFCNALSVVACHAQHITVPKV